MPVSQGRHAVVIIQILLSEPRRSLAGTISLPPMVTVFGLLSTDDAHNSLQGSFEFVDIISIAGERNMKSINHEEATIVDRDDRILVQALSRSFEFELQ